MIDLKQLAADLHLRVTLDPSDTDSPRSERPWLWQIPGIYGHVYVHGTDTLGATCHANRVRSRMVALGTLHQDGDQEFTILFKPANLAKVAGLLKCRKRRVLSPEERERTTAALVSLRALAAQRRLERRTGANSTPDGAVGSPAPTVA